MIICLDYFYEEDLDVNILCRALSNILTDLPYLAGRWKGYLLVGMRSAQSTCHNPRSAPSLGDAKASSHIFPCFLDVCECRHRPDTSGPASSVPRTRASRWSRPRRAIACVMCICTVTHRPCSAVPFTPRALGLETRGICFVLLSAGGPGVPRSCVSVSPSLRTLHV